MKVKEKDGKQVLFDDDGKPIGAVGGLSKSDQKVASDGQIPKEAMEYFVDKHKQKAKE